MIRLLLFCFCIFFIHSVSVAQCDSIQIETNIQTVKTICNTSNGSILIKGSTGGRAPYSWALNDTNFTTSSRFNQLTPGAYLLFTKDSTGCVDSTTAIIENRPLHTEFGIGNAFSPNDDGINDKLNISISSNVISVEIVFINQYGQRVFKTNTIDSPQTWDGIHNGLPLSEGTYFYLVTAKTDCEEGAFSGYITLLR